MATGSDPQENSVGRFLQARRALLSPEEAGVRDFGRRRVPGLRREEVAHLAGVSATYYSRLEQGRDRHPSPDILGAIARALQLDDDARRHLHGLAGTQDPAGDDGSNATGDADPALQRLLDRHVDTPAYLLGRHADVLAANDLARALHVSFAPGRNFAADAFLDEEARAGFHPDDLKTTMAHAVALLHGSEGPGADDARLAELITELSTGSAEFRALWARHDVRRKTAGVKRFVHPVVGEIRLDYNAFEVSGADAQTLVVCHAAPGSENERQLQRLAGLPSP